MPTFGRETGLFVATLTGSFLYTHSDTQWARLHETDGVHRFEPDPAAEKAVHRIANLDIEVPTLTYRHESQPTDAGETRALLRVVALTLQAGTTLDLGAPTTAKEALGPVEQGLLSYRLRASVPLNGFQRTDVSRLVMTFGRLEDVAPVRMALFLELVSEAS